MLDIGGFRANFANGMDRNMAVILIGSNHPLKSRLIEAAARMLADEFVDFTRSKPVRSRDAGGGGSVYDNVVCMGETDMDLQKLSALVKDIERTLGRTSRSKAVGIVEVDIDIVIWNGVVVRPVDASRSYFKEPYSELVGNQNLL